MKNKKSLKNILLKTICENINKTTLDEYTHFQPDLFIRDDVVGRTGEFDINGEKVLVEPSKRGKYNVYKFGPALGDYLLKFNNQPEEIANMYIDDDTEMFSILQYANPDDILIFNTSNGQKIEFPFNEVISYIKGINAFQNRQNRKTVKNEAADETIDSDNIGDFQYEDDPAAEYDEEPDWLKLWKDNQISKDNSESYMDYLNRLNDTYNPYINYDTNENVINFQYEDDPAAEYDDDPDWLKSLKNNQTNNDDIYNIDDLQ